MKHNKLNKKKFAKFVIASMITFMWITIFSSYIDICSNNLNTDSTYWFPWTNAFTEYVAALN